MAITVSWAAACAVAAGLQGTRLMLLLSKAAIEAGRRAPRRGDRQPYAGRSARTSRNPRTCSTTGAPTKKANCDVPRAAPTSQPIFPAIPRANDSAQ